MNCSGGALYCGSGVVPCDGCGAGGGCEGGAGGACGGGVVTRGGGGALYCGGVPTAD